MNTLLLILMAVATLPLFAVAMQTGKSLGRSMAFNATTHPNGVVTLNSEEAFAVPFLIGRPGTAATQVLLCDASETPAYLVEDMAATADIGSPIACSVLGASTGTKIGIASDAIDADVDVCVANGGKLSAVPATAGTYHIVGRSKKLAAADGDQFEFTPCKPIKLVVIAALTSTNGTAAGAADLAALKVEAEKIGDDVRAIAAALATPALVKVLAS